jgi:hypothetical protein
MRPIYYPHLEPSSFIVWLVRHWRYSLAAAAAVVVAGVQVWGWDRVARLLSWLWHAGWPIVEFAALPLAAAGLLYVATSVAGRRWWRGKPWHAARRVAQPAWLPAVVAGIVVLAGMVLLAPGWLVARDTTVNTLTAEQRAKATGDVRTALLQAVGGLLLAAGAAATWRQMRISREGQVTERFTRAVDQLGSEHLDVRLGGLYALERIASDSPGDRRTIAEVLTAYIRHRAPWPPTQPDQYRADWPLEKQPDLRTRAPDVQAALTVLGRGPFPKPMSHEVPRADRLDLREVDLRKADLVTLHLEGAWLDGAHLEGAWLDRMHLEGAQLIKAHLEEAKIDRAHLEHAWINGAHLEQADLSNAYLEGAQLSDAHLEGADLSGAHLKEAQLSGLLLEDARVVGARLEGAWIGGAHLQGARASPLTEWPAEFPWQKAGVIEVDPLVEALSVLAGHEAKVVDAARGQAGPGVAEPSEPQAPPSDVVQTGVEGDSEPTRTRSDD